jgi:AcrR family transcriptional regulator
MANRRAAQKLETRAQILQAAVDLFMRDEGDEVTEVRLKDIAVRAGVAIPSILYHFGSRIGLLRDVSTVLWEEVTGRLPQPGCAGGTTAAVAALLYPPADDGPAAWALWRVGDEITWLEPSATEPYAGVFDRWICEHLECDGFGPDDAEILGRLIAPGLMMVNRRRLLNRAPEELADGFARSVQELLAAWPAKELPARTLQRARRSA